MAFSGQRQVSSLWETVRQHGIRFELSGSVQDIEDDEDSFPE
jgi:hypothetical protein